MREKNNFYFSREPDQSCKDLSNCGYPMCPYSLELIHYYTDEMEKYDKLTQYVSIFRGSGSPTFTLFLLSSDWQSRVLPFHPFFTFSRDQLQRNPWVCAMLYASLSKIYASLHIYICYFPYFLVFLRQFETIYTSAGRD